MKIRIDYATTAFDFTDAPASPAKGSARRIGSEGYLEVDAYLARDGLLRYSDGKTSWLEYRPRDQLEAAAASWHLAPVTDDHPPLMVDATNHSQYARGLVIDRPTIEDIDGVAYLRAKIQIRDAELIRKIEAGKRQLSIGFWSDVKLQRGTVGGKTYDAIQTALRGNHVASVDQGRAGPAVRVLMDSSNCAVHSEGSIAMRTLNIPAALIAVYTAKARAHKDEAGMPTTMAKIVGPDGTELEVPTWLAALVEEAMSARAASEKPAEAPEEQPAAEAEGAPAVPPNPEGEEEKKELPMTPDQINALVASGSRKRARLERLAVLHKVEAAKLDADDIELARALVSKCMPKVKCDALTGDALDSLVDACASIEPPTAPVNPFEVRAPIVDASDEWYERQAKILTANGVAV